MLVNLRSTRMGFKMTKNKKQESVPEESPEQTIEEQEITLETQVVSLTEQLQRAQAELINYRKRIEQQQRDMIQFAGERTIKKFLPVLDNFDMALKHTSNPEEFVVGVQMIAKQFRDALTDEGISSPDLVGQKFDSSIAEAIEIVADETKEHNTVAQEITKAYVLKNKVLRHAKVVVVNNNSEEKTDEKSE